MRNLRVDNVSRAAYEIVGLEVVGGGATSAPGRARAAGAPPIQGVVLENVTVLHYEQARHGIGECVHASVRASDVTPPLPNCTESARRFPRR